MPNSSWWRSRVAAARSSDPWVPESPDVSVISSADSRLAARDRDARLGGEGHLEARRVARGAGRAGQGAEHLPGEAVVVRVPRANRGDAHRDGERAGTEAELRLKVPTGHRLRQDEGAGLTHGDPQVLDVVHGEVETGGQAGRHRAQDRDVGT